MLWNGLEICEIFDNACWGRCFLAMDLEGALFIMSVYNLIVVEKRPILSPLDYVIVSSPQLRQIETHWNQV